MLRTKLEFAISASCGLSSQMTKRKRDTRHTSSYRSNFEASVIFGSEFRAVQLCHAFHFDYVAGYQLVLEGVCVYDTFACVRCSMGISLTVRVCTVLYCGGDVLLCVGKS